MEVPLRTCVACRRRAAQSSLVRLVATASVVQVDPHPRPAGRGAYLCGAAACTEAALRRDATVLRRALRVGDQQLVIDPAALRRGLDVDGAAVG